MSDPIETRLAELGLSLPDAPKPAANYVPYQRQNNLLFISGQISAVAGVKSYEGKLGDSVNLEQGQEAAKLCCLNILAQAKAALGSLDKIAQCVRLTGYVNCTPDYVDQPKVINGASDLMVQILGERGRHTRAAVGVGSLPLGVAVEIDAIFAIME